MDGFKRFGLYMVPDGALYRAGADWLGWDSVTGTATPQPDLPGLPDRAGALTATPRKYGLHGTIKPPFRLMQGMDATGLASAAQAFCAGRAPVTLPRLVLRRLGGFIAIVPHAPSADLADLAGACVTSLDAFRGPPTETELARRRASKLSDRQEALLTRWGYPYVLEEFRFHITLTGNLPQDQAEAALAVLSDHFAPHLVEPARIDSLCLMGEDDAGMFHLIHRYGLTG